MSEAIDAKIRELINKRTEILEIFVSTFFATKIPKTMSVEEAREFFEKHTLVERQHPISREHVMTTSWAFELSPDACDHDPIAELPQFVSSQHLAPGKIGWSFFGFKDAISKTGGWKCRKCGLELRAEWRAK